LRLTLVSVGRTSEPFVREACTTYAEKIRRYASLHLAEVPEERISSRGKKEYIVRQEGLRIQEKLWPGAFIVALDEKGRPLSSLTFACFLEKWSHSGIKEIIFLLGGPYGLDEALKKEADFCLSLSSMTLTHGMAKMVLLEQIYRAFTIFQGTPYHK